ncbi:MAG: hypothetical protein C4527_00965 [Candidatus Omnitrophota bacterium]|jgi:hypothetical protein|nr:MAG: hypothetical protein C4527_00965 [Candidatus Omnitrophota bacterium]
MDSSISLKNRRMHVKCVVCGMGFNAEFDESLNTFPVHHPNMMGKKEFQCEFFFYKALLRLYSFLHRAGSSVPMEIIVRNFNWEDEVYLRKTMIAWCLTAGYLSIDSLRRLTIPPPIKDIWKEIYAMYSLGDPENRAKAIDYLKAALRCLIKELEPVPAGELLDAHPSKSSIDKETENLKAKMKPNSLGPGMATADITGARTRDKRS